MEYKVNTPHEHWHESNLQIYKTFGAKSSAPEGIAGKITGNLARAKINNFSSITN